MSHKPETLRPWETLGASRVYDCRLFSVTESRRRSPRTGELHDFYVLESPDWVNIVPLTPDRRVVMIHQYRHGIGEFTLEIPGGMVDAEDPSPLLAARREMREETGYDSDDVVALGVIHPNPAIQGNRCHTFLARDVEPRGGVSFDSTEETEVVLVSLDEIPRLVREGTINHALVVVAFHHLMLMATRP
jgi:ADP-ribose pyrophosphatase